MIYNEPIPTSCPLCSAPCVLYENSDGNGGIITSYSYDVQWLGDPHNALAIEQGSEDPNTYEGM